MYKNLLLVAIIPVIKSACLLNKMEHHKVVFFFLSLDLLSDLLDENITVHKMFIDVTNVQENCECVCT